MGMGWRGVGVGALLRCSSPPCLCVYVYQEENREGWCMEAWGGEVGGVCLRRAGGGPREVETRQLWPMHVDPHGPSPLSSGGRVAHPPTQKDTRPPHGGAGDTATHTPHRHTPRGGEERRKGLANHFSRVGELNSKPQRLSSAPGTTNTTCTFALPPRPHFGLPGSWPRAPKPPRGGQHVQGTRKGRGSRVGQGGQHGTPSRGRTDPKECRLGGGGRTKACAPLDRARHLGTARPLWEAILSQDTQIQPQLLPK